MKIRALAASLVAAAVVSTAAQAADVSPIVIPVAPPVVVAPPVATSPWGGAYVGGIVGWFVGDGEEGVVYGGVAGFNFARGSFVFGPEVFAEYLSFFNNGVVAGRARVGVALGAHDRLLAFAGAGLGVFFGNGSGLMYQLFGGAELALGSRLSLRAEVTTFGFPGTTCVACEIQATGGLVFHFGG